MRDTPLTDKPLSDNEIDHLFSINGIRGEEVIAVAVSGGADSMALMHLFAEWVRPKPVLHRDNFDESEQIGNADQVEPGKPKLLILTVDHGVRAEAAGETTFVCEKAKQLGLEYELLRCEGLAEKNGLQQAAREARYDLMQSVMKARGINSLVTAHTLDDQIETFFMRLLRGSGVDGLAAMAKQTQLFGMTIVRPFLGLSKTRLRASLSERSAQWIEDPSNEREEFERVRVRKLISALVTQGLSFENMKRSLIRLGDTKEAINDWCQDWLSKNVLWHKAGLACCRFDQLIAAPKDLQVRILTALVRATGGTTPLPRRQKFEQSLKDLLKIKSDMSEIDYEMETHLEQKQTDLTDSIFLTGRGFKVIFRTSLGGALIECIETPDQGGHLDEKWKIQWMRVYRELGRLPPTRHSISPGETLIWDERIQFNLCHSVGQSLDVRPLSKHDYVALKRAQSEMKTNFPELPAREIALTCAGFYLQEELIAVPQFGYFLDEAILSTNYLPHMDKKEVIQSQFPVS